MKNPIADISNELYLHQQPKTGAVDIAFKSGVVILALLIMVSGAIYQAQIALTGGRAPITGIFLKLTLVFFLLTLSVLRRRIHATRLIFSTYLFISYLGLDALFLVAVKHREPLDVLTNFNASYVMFALVAVAAAANLRVPHNLIVLSFMLAFVLCAILGISQYVSHDPIVPTASSDGNFEVRDYTSGSDMRAFSLFHFPGEFGTVSAIAGCIAISRMRRKNRVSLSLLLFLISAFCCYVAGTRSEFISFSCGTVTVVILTWKRMSWTTKWIPLAWVMFGILVALVAFQRLQSVGVTGGVAGAGSFGQRIMEWGFYLADLRTKSVPELLFGQGIYQGTTGAASLVIPVDNLYLAIILNIGFIGMILLLYLIWTLWRNALLRCREAPSDINLAAAGMLSTYFAVGIFSLDPMTVATFTLLSVLSSSHPENVLIAKKSPLTYSPSTCEGIVIVATKRH